MVSFDANYNVVQAQFVFVQLVLQIGWLEGKMLIEI